MAIVVKTNYILLFFFLCGLTYSCNSKPREISASNTTKNSAKESLEIKHKDSLNISKAFVLGKFNYKTDPTFIKVKAEHTTKTLYLNKDVYNAFVQMYDSATKDSIELKIVSGTRNFYEQKAIWERKWKTYQNLNFKDRALKILEYSAMPSTSRHHWGTDIDLNSLNNSYFNSGKGLELYKWLVTNAHKFGFYQVYTEKTNGRTGYNLEKWHWSYLPLAKPYLEYYNSNVMVNDIVGFEGAELAKSLHIIDNYVNGVSKKVKAYNQH